jgi:hypothetical protein
VVALNEYARVLYAVGNGVYVIVLYAGELVTVRLSALYIFSLVRFVAKPNEAVVSWFALPPVLGIYENSVSVALVTK